MAITQQELAKELGVAQVTVSRALRQDKGVSERLRNRIQSAAERHGYSIHSSNQEARMLRQRAAGGETRTNIICAVVLGDDDPAGFGGRILHGMNDEGEAMGSEVVMVTRCRQPFPLVVSRRQVDGAIRLLSDIDVASGIGNPPVPWVSLLYDVPGVDLIAVDNFGGARNVGRLLCKQGHKRIAFIGPDTDLARERLAGLRAAAAESGAVVPDDLVCMERFVASEQPTLELLAAFIGGRSTLPFTALVGYNDYMADMALRYVSERGLRVPGDLSIAGFDGVVPGYLHEKRRITSAAIPLEELGRSAVRLLSWRLQSPDAPRRKIVLETALIEGETSGPPGWAGSEKPV